jgi:propanediol dehydratase large subunit
MCIDIAEVRIHSGNLAGHPINLAADEAEASIVGIHYVTGQVVVAEMSAFVDGLRGDPD